MFGRGLHRAGAMNWVERMTRWSRLDDYNSANRTWFVNGVSGDTEMYVKEFDRFHFYWVLGAGHSVCGLMLIIKIKL